MLSPAPLAPSRVATLFKMSPLFSSALASGSGHRASSSSSGSNHGDTSGMLASRSVLALRASGVAWGGVLGEGRGEERMPNE